MQMVSTIASVSKPQNQHLIVAIPPLLPGNNSQLWEGNFVQYMVHLSLKGANMCPFEPMSRKTPAKDCFELSSFTRLRVHRVHFPPSTPYSGKLRGVDKSKALRPKRFLDAFSLNLPF